MNTNAQITALAMKNVLSKSMVVLLVGFALRWSELYARQNTNASGLRRIAGLRARSVGMAARMAAETATSYRCENRSATPQCPFSPLLSMPLQSQRCEGVDITAACRKAVLLVLGYPMCSGFGVTARIEVRRRRLTHFTLSMFRVSDGSCFVRAILCSWCNRD
jgi:hypothetical protein